MQMSNDDIWLIENWSLVENISTMCASIWYTIRSKTLPW